MLRRSHAVVIAIFLSAALCACASAARLVWDANTEPHLRGYKIHYGSASGQYTETVDVGNVTEWPIPDEWPRDRSYYFAATAYAECVNAQGQPYTCESGFSNEAVYFAEATPPSPATDVRIIFQETQKMSWELVQSNSASNDASATSIAVTLNNVSAGNLIVVIVGMAFDDSAEVSGVSDGTSNFTDGTGLITYGGFNPKVQGFYLLSSNAGNKTYTATFAATTGDRKIIAMEFSYGGEKYFDVDNGVAFYGDAQTDVITTQTTHDALVVAAAEIGWTNRTWETPKIGDTDATWESEDLSTTRAWYLAEAVSNKQGTALLDPDSGGVGCIMSFYAIPAKAIPPSILSRQRNAFHHMMIR